MLIVKVFIIITLQTSLSNYLSYKGEKEREKERERERERKKIRKRKRGGLFSDHYPFV